VPDGVSVILPAARLLADARELVLRQAATGVIWPNDCKIAELAPYLDWLALVALVFPNFRDGRAYSQARLLRERYHFRGELRATGQVLRDQLLFLQRAGFDAFEVTKDADAAAFADAVRRYSVFYQPTGDGRASTLTARRARGPSMTFKGGANTWRITEVVDQLSRSGSPECRDAGISRLCVPRAHEPARQRAGVLTLFERRRARQEGGNVAVDALHEAAAAGRKIVDELRLVTNVDERGGMGRIS